MLTALGVAVLIYTGRAFTLLQHGPYWESPAQRYDRQTARNGYAIAFIVTAVSMAVHLNG
jgi:hypothetical protein